MCTDGLIPRSPSPRWIATRAAINTALHAGLGVSPCDTACTHVVSGRWTALGIANTIANRNEAERAAELARQRRAR